MNRDELEPLPKDVALLLQRGRPGVEPPAGAREATLSFVAAQSVAAGALGAAQVATAGARSLRWWTATKGSFGVGGILLGIALGAGGHAMYVSRDDAAVAVRAPPAALASAPVAPLLPPDRPLESTRPEMTPSAARNDVAPASPPATHAAPADGSAETDRDGSLGKERALIDTARTAVARGDGEGALATLTRHAHDFPRGRLAEEREWSTIQALVLGGRTNEAQARATTFRRLFPRSLMLPALDQVVPPMPAASTIRKTSE